MSGRIHFSMYWPFTQEFGWPVKLLAYYRCVLAISRADHGKMRKFTCMEKSLRFFFLGQSFQTTFENGKKSVYIF